MRSSSIRTSPQKHIPGDRLSDRAGIDVQRACVMLGVSSSGYLRLEGPTAVEQGVAPPLAGW
jgi:hypothetical protein